MWHWDQGHLGYFQFDKIRAIAGFVTKNNFKNSSRATLKAATGLEFKAPPSHSPWRNYSRALKLCLLVSENGNKAEPTYLAKLLATPGAITCDEYLHFLAQASTEPSPALSGYSPTAEFRYPLLFALKYMLAKVAIKLSSESGLYEIMEAYDKSGLTGDEDETKFISAIALAATGATVSHNDLARQARESLLVLCQISYLNSDGKSIFLSIDPSDARDLFNDLTAITGPYQSDPGKEIQRRASLFSGSNLVFDYPKTAVSEVVQSGFAEGSKVEKTHIVIERNTKLRVEYFKSRPTEKCDVCTLLTKKTYNWTDGVLDLHHLLPLSSGTRTDAKKGTLLDDLVPVCPTCHRSVHKFYNAWLKKNKQKDFIDSAQAKLVYGEVKKAFKGTFHA